MRTPSLIALVPLVMTVLVLVAVIVSTTVTVRADRRRNAGWAVQWAKTLHRRRAIAVPSRLMPPLPVVAPKRDVA
jgi:hypothetical protein